MQSNLKKNLSEGLEQYGITRILGFTIPDPRIAKIINDNSSKCNKQCDTLEFKEQKNLCISKCKISTQLQIIAAIKQAITKAPTQNAKIKYSEDLKRAQLRLLQYRKTLTRVMIAYKKFQQTENAK